MPAWSKHPSGTLQTSTSCSRFQMLIVVSSLTPRRKNTHRSWPKTDDITDFAGVLIVIWGISEIPTRQTSCFTWWPGRAHPHGAEPKAAIFSLVMNYLNGILVSQIKGWRQMTGWLLSGSTLNGQTPLVLVFYSLSFCWLWVDAVEFVYWSVDSAWKKTSQKTSFYDVYWKHKPFYVIPRLSSRGQHTHSVDTS